MTFHRAKPRDERSDSRGCIRGIAALIPRLGKAPFLMFVDVAKTPVLDAYHLLVGIVTLTPEAESR